MTGRRSLAPSSGSGSSPVYSPLTPPILANFPTTYGTFTSAQKIDRVRLTIPSNGGSAVLPGIQKAATFSPPWTIDFGQGVVSSPPVGDSVWTGCSIMNGSGQFLAFYAGGFGGGAQYIRIGVDNWNSSTSFNAAVIGPYGFLFTPQIFFLRITHDGTNIKFWFSSNYKDFIQIGTSFLGTSFGTVTAWGFSYYNNSQGTPPIPMLCDLEQYLEANSVLGDKP